MLMNLLNQIGLSPQMAIALALPLFGGLLLLIAAFSGNNDRDRFKRRVGQMRLDASRRKKVAGETISVKLSQTDSSIPLFDRLIKALPRRDQLRMRLARAGLSISLGSYLTISLVIGIVVFTLALLTGMVGIPLGALIGATAALALPHIATGALAKRRQAKFIDNFPEAIDLMTRGLKSGLPIIESIKTAGEEVPDPVGTELRQVTDAVRLGNKLEEELDDTSSRLGLQEFKFFTISLAIQSETGGNLAETLNNLADVLRKRRQLKLKIKALSSEAKASAYIIGSLPFIMAVMIYMINPRYISALWLDPRGHVLVGLGLFSFFVGAAVMYKMVRFDY